MEISALPRNVYLSKHTAFTLLNTSDLPTHEADTRQMLGQPMNYYYYYWRHVGAFSDFHAAAAADVCEQCARTHAHTHTQRTIFSPHYATSTISNDPVIIMANGRQCKNHKFIWKIQTLKDLQFTQNARMHTVHTSYTHHTWDMESYVASVFPNNEE